MPPEGIKRVFATSLTEMLDSAAEEVGTLRFEGSKLYKYVFFRRAGAAADVAILAGDLVYYDDYDLGYVHGDFSASVGGAAGIGAGIAMAAWLGTVAGGDKYGWIQIGGIASITDDVVAGAIGNKLTTVGGTDTNLDVAALVSDVQYAILYDDTTTAQKILCTFPW